MQMEGKEEKEGEAQGKDQKGQMNDGKMMCEMKGK